MGVVSHTIQMPTLYPKQRACFFGPERISITEASTKAGKTAGALAWIIGGLIGMATPSSGLWCAPVYPQAKMAYNRTLRMLSSIPRDFWSKNDTELFVDLPGGSRLWFKGSDKPDGIYGPDYAFAVIDEASRCKEAAWVAVRSTTTATRGKIRIIGNVRGQKNWAFRLGLKARQGDPNMEYHKLTAYDAVEAGVLDAEEIEQAKSQLTEAQFKELYLAIPSDDGGNPFGMQHISACFGSVEAAPPICYGLDLAKSVDWTWLIGLSELGHVTKSERWQDGWVATKGRVLATLGGLPCLADSTGVGDAVVEEMQRDGGNIEGFKFTSTSKQQLMEGLAIAIQQHKVRFEDERLKEELESFTFEHTRTGVRYTAPEGLHDDGVCGLALAVKQWTSHTPFALSVVGGKAQGPRKTLAEMGSDLPSGDELAAAMRERAQRWASGAM